MGWGALHGNNWHLTYATAVTLLLAFFIIAFALHLYVPPNDGFEDITARETDPFPQLYAQLSRYANDSNLEAYVTVSYSGEYILISFDHNFLFERSFSAASSRLNARELEILNFMGHAIKSAEDEAEAICVIGYAESWGDNLGSDREISAGRANAVLMYLEENVGINPEKLILMAFGSNSPAEGSPNRVEILIK